MTLSPGATSLHAGASLQFAVSGHWSDGGTSAPTVTYSSTGGAISTGGMYVAGSAHGVYRVIARQQGGTMADTTVLTVTTLTKLTLSPGTASVSSGTTRQFSAMGTRTDGSVDAQTVTYSATGGTISADGLFKAGTTAGTFRVIAVNKGGSMADTSTVTIPTGASAPGQYKTPDLINHNFDDGNFSWLTNFPGGTPRHRISRTGGVNGSQALEAFWAPGLPDFSPADIKYTSGGHRFVRLYFKLTAKMLHGSSNVKVFRFTDPNRGGIFSNPSQSWGFGFDYEAQSVAAAIGVFEGSPTSSFVSGVGSQYVTASNIAGDGKFHWIEIEYDRNAPGGLVEARIWFDGKPIVMPTSTSKGALANDGYFMTGFAWKGGVSGQTPSTLYATRQSGSPTTTNSFGPIEEYSGGIQSTGSMFVDNIAVSTSRIGP